MFMLCVQAVSIATMESQLDEAKSRAESLQEQVSSLQVSGRRKERKRRRERVWEGGMES